MNTKLKFIVGALALSMVSLNAGAVTAADAAKLGSSLTPVGAEKAGNADGSIPEWTGGLTPSAGTLSSDGHLSNPFSGEKPLFTITAANVEQYRDLLTPGQQALFKRYPATYQLPVYPSHRTAGFPQKYLDATKANVGVVSTTADGNGLVNYADGVPFPLPEKGVEVIWNHVTRWRGGSMDQHIAQMPVQADGSYTNIKVHRNYAWDSALEGGSRNPNVLFYFYSEVTSPARLSGNKTLVHETIDQVKEPRSAWQYTSGQRRVRRAPQIAYDSPRTAGDGLATTDSFEMFNGAPDRYDWELVGKKEMLVPFNAYMLADPNIAYDDIIKAGHMNPQYVRFEKQRVWVVRAKLKSGKRHVYATREFYVQEDGWQIVLEDIYDNRGELWRTMEQHQLMHYDVNVNGYAVETSYDLTNGRYLLQGLSGEEDRPYKYGAKFSESDFSPAALRSKGIR